MCICKQYNMRACVSQCTGFTKTQKPGGTNVIFCWEDRKCFFVGVSITASGREVVLIESLSLDFDKRHTIAQYDSSAWRFKSVYGGSRHRD